MLPWGCTIKILFTCCTLCPTALPLAVPHELFSASWWGWRDYGQVQGSPAVSGPLPLPIGMLYVYYLSKNCEFSGQLWEKGYFRLSPASWSPRASGLLCLYNCGDLQVHVSRTSQKRILDDTIAQLTQAIYSSTIQRQVDKFRSGLEHNRH